MSESENREFDDIEDSRFFGIKGWLIFFVLTYGLGSIIGVISFMQRLTKPSPPHFPLQILAYDFAITFILPFAVLILIFRKVRYAPNVWIAAIWAIVIYRVYLVVEHHNLLSIPMYGGGFFLEIIVYAFCGALFTWYLVSSRRVNCTYHRKLPT